MNDDAGREPDIPRTESAQVPAARPSAEDELARTRQALRESQERLTAALAAAGTGTFRWVLSLNALELDVNSVRLLGFAPGIASVSLEQFLAVVHPADRPVVAASCTASARDAVELDIEFRVIRPDASLHWIAQKAKVVRDATGTPAYATGAFADVTSRKTAESALRESQQHLQGIFNHAAVGIAVAGLDGRFLDMNGRFAEILGYPPDELAVKTFIGLTHPDDMAATLESVRRLIGGQATQYSLEKRYVRKDGTTVWSSTTVTLVKDPEGRPQRFVGVIDDISARKDAESALRDEARHLELLNQTGQTLASDLDLPSLVQAITDAGTQLSGAQFGAFFSNATDENGDVLLLYSLSGAEREAFEKLGPPRATALLGPTFRGDEVIRCDDVTTDPRYGTTGRHHGMPPGHLPVRSYLAVPVKSRNGEPIGGLIFGHPEPGVFTERAERLVVGIAGQAGIAIDNARLYDTAQKVAAERNALLESERAARSAAERLSELKDEFLATLSHELRTPLNAIMGWSQVLRSGPKAPADYVKGLETIERNARVQTQLIEDLLDMSRVTSGKLRLDVQPIMPVSFIEAAIETVKPATDAKGIRLERVLDPAAGPITGDPGRLQQVVWNLLSNAIKFTPKDGKIQVLLERVNSHIELSVADTGVGIKPEFIPHLFERFRQGDASTTRRYGGLGLGLSIVKSLVELHGGSVSVKSAGEHQGTTVTVHLPLTVVHRPSELRTRLHPRASHRVSALTTGPELEGLKILVVDDQEDARELIKRVLEDCAAEVITAANTSQALLLVESERPDILVSDIGMPDHDGFELLRRVRTLGPQRGGRVPAIALTAFARSEDRTQALRAGFLVHLAKPVDATELIATVASVAGRTDRIS